MKYLMLIALFIAFESTKTSDPVVHSKINTSYLTLLLDSDKTHPKQHWQPIHKTSTGNFECQWLANGDVSLKYNSHDTLQHLDRRDDLKKEYLDHISGHIKSFKRFGIYSDPYQPLDIFYVFYIDPKKPNSLLIQLISLAGYQVLGSTYFSDKPVNPFGGMALLVIDKKEHIFKLEDVKVTVDQ